MIFYRCLLFYITLERKIIEFLKNIFFRTVESKTTHEIIWIDEDVWKQHNLTDNTNEMVVIKRKRDELMIRVLTIENTKEHSIQSIDLKSHSTKVFIDIRYEGRDECIDIDLDDKYFTCNNEILSTTFLSYYMNIEIPEEYKVHLIDTNINCITLHRNQYIKILQDSYEVITI